MEDSKPECRRFESNFEILFCFCTVSVRVFLPVGPSIDSPIGPSICSPIGRLTDRFFYRFFDPSLSFSHRYLYVQFIFRFPNRSIYPFHNRSFHLCPIGHSIDFQSVPSSADSSIGPRLAPLSFPQLVPQSVLHRSPGLSLHRSPRKASDSFVFILQ